jgi:carboxypeptidase Taq
MMPDHIAKLNELKTRLRTVRDLRMANALLEWDQATYMPPGGAAARGRQQATLSRLAQEHFVDPEVGRLLDGLEPWAAEADPDDDDAALVRVTRWDYDRAVRVPAELVAEMAAHGAAAYQTWTVARPANDFATVRGELERSLELSRRLAACFPEHSHPADAFIDFSEPGMTAAKVQEVFAALRTQLVPLVKAVTAAKPPDDSVLKQRYPEQQQLAFGESVIRDYGYDFRRGRQDRTHHPFMTKFSVDDVRITTRYREDDLSDGLFSTLHEAGHALYEQGVDPALEGTPLASGTSAGVHESQSRLWENLVGRSRGFWHHYLPRLKASFPEQLDGVSLDDFYRSVNVVRPSLIRVDADEVTYNLHVMLRFELELALLEGRLEVKELPEAWRARYEEDLGVSPPDDRDGVLQDVHWYGGAIGGAFHGYTLGNIMAAQFYRAALEAHPEIPAEIAGGRFDTLRAWLTDQVYRHGRKRSAEELLERATGRGLDIGPYMDYLRGKYGELYAV